MPKKPYIRPDVLQIYIFKLRVVLDKRSGEDRFVLMASASLCGRPAQQAETRATRQMSYSALANTCFLGRFCERNP